MDLSKNRTKMVDNREKMDDDLISELPDFILSTILSNLTTKEAIQTSVLSNRWRYTWVERSNNFNFDLPNMFGTCLREVVQSNFLNPGSVDEERRKFGKAVDHILKFYQLKDTRKINTFKLSFYLGEESTLCINEWATSALKLGVADLSLLFSRDSYYREFHIMIEKFLYSFPHQLLSQLNTSNVKKLRLEACILKPSLDSIVFLSNLRTLQLHEVFVAEDFVHHLLSCCLLLDELMMFRMTGISKLNVVSSSVRLLSVIHTLPLDKIQINAMNLITFEFSFRHKSENFSFIKAPLLSELYFWNVGREKLDIVSRFAYMPKLEILYMDLIRFDKVKLHGCISSFRNLKQLELVMANMDDLIWITPTLQCLPLLQKLSIMLMLQINTPREIRHDEFREYPKSELKEVEMQGFIGAWCELEFLKYVFETAIKLERVVINPYSNVNCGAGRRFRYPPCEELWYDSGREATRNFLEEELPVGVELILETN